MYDEEDEIEIKVEYFESFEVNPLSDIDQETCEDNANNVRSTLSNSNVVEIKKEEEDLEGLNPEDDETLNNYDNNDPLELGSNVKWHKLINKFGRYVCKFCDLSYSTVQTLRYHVKTKHTDNYHYIINGAQRGIRQRKFRCHICNIKFQNPTDLQMHIQNHGLIKTQIFCSLCHASFEEHNDLLNHMANQHKLTKKKIHNCSICGYSTSKIYNFKQHLNIHTNKNKKKCVHCSYSTNRPSNLKIHERTHSNVKRYVCGDDGCDYRCATASALRSHRLQHNKEEHMLYCNTCNYGTVYVQSLNKHLDSHRRNKIKGRHFKLPEIVNNIIKL